MDKKFREGSLQPSEERLDLLGFRFICDIMMNFQGPIRPAICLANDLASRGHDVSVISPLMSSDVEKYLQKIGITPLNLRMKHVTSDLYPSLLWFETWAQEAFLKLISKHIGKESSFTLNFSQVASAPCLVSYLQGPISMALQDLEKEYSAGLRFAYNVLKPLIRYVDGRLIGQIGKVSTLAIANSKFCASMYSKFGVEIHDVIYPPIDCATFHPSTSSPSSSYVLTYFGKETKFSVVKKLADMSVKIKTFGSKIPSTRRDLVEHPNIEFMGKISTSTLVDAYSNALFTVFPFTHEPFGYIPLESMACGTPVLTHNKQGPSEYVIDGLTGWLVDTDEQLIYKAMELWKDCYPSIMKESCVKEAVKFDETFYIEKWMKTLSDFT